MPSTQGHKREGASDEMALEGIEEALRCLTLIGHVPRSENTWADRCNAAAEVLHRTRNALSNPVRGEGERWTIYVCRKTNSPYMCGCEDTFDGEGNMTMDCRAEEEVEVVRADEGLQDFSAFGDGLPADEDSQGEALAKRIEKALAQEEWGDDLEAEVQAAIADYRAASPSKGSE